MIPEKPSWVCGNCGAGVGAIWCDPEKSRRDAGLPRAATTPRHYPRWEPISKYWKGGNIEEVYCGAECSLTINQYYSDKGEVR